MQRFVADAGLYLHLHLLVADGVWRQTSDGRVEFLPVSEPTREDLHAVLAAVHNDLAAAGLHDDDAPDVDPSLVACAQMSLSTTAATQPRAVDAITCGPPSLPRRRRPRHPRRRDSSRCCHPTAVLPGPLHGARAPPRPAPPGQLSLLP